MFLSGNRIKLIICSMLLTLSGFGQSLLDELNSLYNVSRLPVYCGDSRVFQVSSHDPTGGNDDGFEGTYSFISRNEDSSLVIFDVEGAGVIERIATPTPSDDTLDLFFDHAPEPSFSIKFSDLFSGKVFPFVPPLTGVALGGCYCYFPILFQHGCKIVSHGKRMQFYQIQYRQFPKGTVVKNFTPHLDTEEINALKRVADVWSKHEGDLPKGGGHSITHFSLQPGDRKIIWELKKGGRILGIKLGPASSFTGLSKDIDIRITWDRSRTPAVYCPVADLFGYAFGNPSMKSLLLGTRGDENYCYFPMPFDSSARVELIYRKTSGRQSPVRCTSEIICSNVRRDKEKEGRFYACWRSVSLPAGSPPHVLLDTYGKGHYVGTLLQAQGLQAGMTNFFEGDDSTAVDGVASILGTGSEDYFNGGWYACPDRWDARKSLPIHGALDYSLPLARTGGYRLYLSDKIPFEKSFFQNIEHGPTARGLPVDYTSISFYYCNAGPSHAQTPTNERCSIFILDTLMLYPQLMQYTVWGSMNMEAKGTKYNTGGWSCIYSTNGKSRLKIIFPKIPFGEYQLFADLVKTPGGCRFSAWQEQARKTDWMDTYSVDTQRVEMLYVCDVRMDEFQNAVTLTFNTDKIKNSLFLNRLILVRKKEDHVIPPVTVWTKNQVE